MKAAASSIAGLLLIAAAAATAQGRGQSVTTVEVFANSAMNITPGGADRPYKLTIYRMDGLQRVEQDLSRQLPKDETAARQWLQQNQARIKREYSGQAVNAANAIAMANYYHINRLPAVLINRQVVVYGLTDVDAAIERYRQAGPAGASRSTP